MKLQQNHVQCNSAVQFNDILSAYIEATTSLHALLKSKVELTQKSTDAIGSMGSTDSTNIPLMDSLGRVHAFPLSKGHVCVIGQDHDNLIELAKKIQDHLADLNHPAKIISLNDFLNVISNNINHSDHNYIVLFDNAIFADKLSDFESIAPLFSNFFVFALAGLSVSCSLNGRVRSNIKTNRILSAFKGNISLRKYMVSTLSANEFVAITAWTENIRTLTTLTNQVR